MNPFKAGVLARFLWVVVPLYVLLFLGFNVYFKGRIDANADEMLFHKAFTLTNTIALLVAEPLGEKHLATIPLVLSTLVADLDVEAIRVESLSDGMVYSYGSLSGVSPDLLCDEVVTYANKNGIRTVGKVTLGLTRARVDLWVKITVRALVVSGILLTCLLVAVIILAYYLSAGRQLSGLIASIRHYQSTGSHHDVPVKADDQLGEVIRAYNVMQTESAEQRRDIEERSQQLEKSVDIRTKAYADEMARHKLTASKLSELIGDDNNS